MTNWPNIQEYRNFEAKFFDNSKDKNSIDSAEENDAESVQRNEYKDKIYSDNSYNNVTTNHSSESKTVRCVIRKDFEEAFKKLDRGDGLALICDGLRPNKAQDTTSVDQSIVDKVRLQNHLKWKKQKEEEYFQKKEAERIAQLKKKEEESRLERLKKQKEKERMEKLKEWQEHKAREKEEKKREKMVMKELEEELKGVTFTVDKEKLIAEWVKIKNRQKQMEAEKKAEMLKKEEENRALRQSLAELSYKQWKERVKGRMMTLPKNGYQIFGPKPVPVVKEDWNHNFASSSPRNQIHQDVGLRNTKSNTSTFTLRPTVKEFENLTKESFYLGDLKKRTKSFCQLKTAKTGSNLFGESEAPRKREQYGMPLKELQPGTVDFKKNWSNNLKNGFGDKRHRTVCNSASQDLSEESQTFSKNMRKHEETFKQLLSSDFSSLLGNFSREGGDHNRCFSKSHGVISSTLLDELSESLGLSSKKKLDLYINANPCDEEEDCPKKITKKKIQVTKSNDIKSNTEKKRETGGKQNPREPNKKNLSKERCSGHTHIITDPVCSRKERKPMEKCVTTEPGTKQKIVESQKAKENTYRRSRSYDKPIKKCLKDAEKVKGCSSSMSFTKVRGGAGEDPCKRLKLTKSKTSTCQRKSRRRSKPNTPDAEPPRRTGDKKAAVDSETKPRKKLKKKNAFLSKSLSFSDSPYSIKKNKSKSLEKVKGSRPKALNKDAGAKTSESGQCRKLTSTKV